jgi:hypothetical protein
LLGPAVADVADIKFLCGLRRGSGFKSGRFFYHDQNVTFGGDGKWKDEKIKIFGMSKVFGILFLFFDQSKF